MPGVSNVYTKVSAGVPAVSWGESKRHSPNRGSPQPSEVIVWGAGTFAIFHRTVSPVVTFRVPGVQRKGPWVIPTSTVVAASAVSRLAGDRNKTTAATATIATARAPTTNFRILKSSHNYHQARGQPPLAADKNVLSREYEQEARQSE